MPPTSPDTTTSLLAVLKLFLIPVGGGIPAGVMLAKAQGLLWPVTALLYLISDVLLALIFEPTLRLCRHWFGTSPLFIRLGTAFQTATARSVAHFDGIGAGPLALVLIAFGVDPMTGRTAALAAGHGCATGWAIAISGDMLYYGVIALATLRVNDWLQNPNLTMLIILAAMFLLPVVIRALRTGRGATETTRTETR